MKQDVGPESVVPVDGGTSGSTYLCCDGTRRLVLKVFPGRSWRSVSTEVRILQRVSQKHRSVFVCPISSQPERWLDAWGYRYPYIVGEVLGVDGELRPHAGSSVKELGRIVALAVRDLSGVWQGNWPAPRAVSSLRRELTEAGNLLRHKLPQYLVGAVLSVVRVCIETLNMVGGRLRVQHVHGDIHAGNVIVPSRGGAKVIDTSGLRVRIAVREIAAALAKVSSVEGQPHSDVLDNWRLTLAGYLDEATILPAEVGLVPVAVGAKLVGELCYLLQLKRGGVWDKRQELLFMGSVHGCQVLSVLFKELVEVVNTERFAQGEAAVGTRENGLPFGVSEGTAR